MEHQEMIAGAIEEATKEVFATMLGSEIALVNDSAGIAAESGVVSLVGLTGEWSGTGTVSCSTAVAKLVAVRMLMLDPEDSEAIDDEVLDAVAELTNMVVGNIKNLLCDQMGEMAISIPTVVYGRNFRFKNLAGTTETSSCFEWEGHRVDIKVCLAQTKEKSSSFCDRLVAPAFSAE